MELILAFLAWIGFIEREKPPSPRPPAVVETQALEVPVYSPPPILGGSPVPPEALPPARSCKEGVGEVWRRRFDTLPGQVNGALVKGAEGLRRLRLDWKDALVIVRGGDFSGADLGRLRLHNLCFIDSKFAGSDWRNARAAGIGFLWSDLTGAQMQGARMPHILIEDPFLAQVDATGADFSDGVLAGSSSGSWEDLRLDRANLRRFRFDCGIEVGDQCAYRTGASFRGADLRDARIDTFWGEADWAGARLDRTEVSLRQLADLLRARLHGPLIVREGKVTAALSPAEFRWLGRHILEPESLEKPMRGARPAGMGPGTVALFAAPPIAFDAAVRASPLYRRLSPVLIMGASSILLVEVRGSGRIDVQGRAIGGNAHSCSLSGKNLRFDGATGWFVGEDQGDDSTGAPPPDRPVPVVTFSAGRVDVYERGHPFDEKDFGFSHFGLCGARAGFDRMIRIPLSPARAKRLYETWG